MRQAQGMSVAILTAVILLSSGSVKSIDSKAAVRAADIWTELRPGDDIQGDFRASHVQIADLDRDGVEEVAYLVAAPCIGANFDCTNEVKVLTALEPNDPRIHPGPLDNDDMTDFWRRAKAGGYGEDASLQIPGEVRTLIIAEALIYVTFDVKEDASICKRTIERGQGGTCPQPGRYTWTLAWRQGSLSLVDATPLNPQRRARAK